MGDFELYWNVMVLFPTLNVRMNAANRLFFRSVGRWKQCEHITPAVLIWYGTQILGCAEA